MGTTEESSEGTVESERLPEQTGQDSTLQMRKVGAEKARREAWQKQGSRRACWL